jgi:uncharacterized protein YdaU (DUF1376 family)
MNYFEHHIGDYAEETSHLSFIEDAAYSRCIRKYYSTEKPLPADVAKVQRMVGARTKEERAAVETILLEFFDLRDDGWHNDRCDEGIARYLAGEPEREAKKANEETRLKRHREERATLFQKLTAAGQHAAWNIGIKELRELVKALPETAAQPLAVTPPATAPATPATATQTPIPTTQPPDINDVSGQSPDATQGDDGDGEQVEKRKRPRSTEEDHATARWMFEQVRIVNPTAKTPNWDTWADHVRLMRELDLRTHEQMYDLFRWAKRDAFWCANIQSPAKLREKWDTLTAQRARAVRGANGAQNDKFHFADADRTGDKAAMQATIARHNIVIPLDGEIEF